jgi:hypothetical protein
LKAQIKLRACCRHRNGWQLWQESRNSFCDKIMMRMKFSKKMLKSADDRVRWTWVLIFRDQSWFQHIFDYRRCSCRRRITLKHWTTLCLNAFRAFYSSLLLSYIIMASPFALFYTPRVSSPPPTTFFFHTHKNLWGVFLGWEESFYKFLQSVVSWPRGRSQLFTSVVSTAVFLFFCFFTTGFCVIFNGFVKNYLFLKFKCVGHDDTIAWR